MPYLREPLISAFKILRKAGYKCYMNKTEELYYSWEGNFTWKKHFTNPNSLLNADKFVFSRLSESGNMWKYSGNYNCHARLGWKGNLTEICAILESQGLVVEKPDKERNCILIKLFRTESSQT
jgi:hypothetical protein